MIGEGAVVHREGSMLDARRIRSGARSSRRSPLSSRHFRALLAGSATLIALGLASCSSDGPTAEPGASAPGSSAPAASAPATSAPASSAPASSAPASSAPAESSAPADDADGSGKPAKDEIIPGLTKFYVDTQNMEPKKAKKFAVCMVDETYDKASPELLIMMRDGAPDPANVSAEDKNLLFEAGVTCAPEAE
jgi:hypothetical protein